MIRRLTTAAALAVLAWTLWTMTTSPDREHPDVAPATVAPAVTVELEEAG